ncbi:Thioredoxin-domain-containing protein [Mycena indigotica]|uniref:Thioredoxin-domain-containing protein n=1 Tax=Mycena indigotica TaxID=2126181 RepID=A0A8H6SHB3_9AGAR|nr:Thioredoxin-domain-containing protein [Mycena indigotica]KAF7298958.1 Thioredoxin-domain-containing protein [Mycena indigotica]
MASTNYSKTICLATDSESSRMDSCIQVITAALARQPVLRRLSSPKRRQFAFDLAFIALGCRTAWLVDVVTVVNQEQVFEELLSSLRAVSAEFTRIKHIFESTSSQSFFVNLDQLEMQNLKDIRFIFLGETPQRVAEPPVDVQSALLHLKATSSFPGDLGPLTSIPLAALLLGYPVAYIVADTTSVFLSHTPLDVYLCSISSPKWADPHTMIKFSCPAGLSEQLSPLQVTAQLKNRFQQRITDLGLELSVLHHVETLDRVAL